MCDTAQLSTVQNCVALGLGVSLVPRALAVSDTSGQIIYRALSGNTPQRKIAAATHTGALASFLARQFIDIVRDAYPGSHTADVPAVEATEPYPR